jgi:hypothetical protein
MNIRISFTLRSIALGVLAVTLAATLAGCAAAVPNPVARMDAERPMAGAPAMPLPLATAAPSAVAPSADAPTGESPAGGANQAQPRLIIRTADLTLVVKDTQAQLDAIGRIAREHGGFVVSSSTTRHDDELHGQVTLRVAAAQFDQALDLLRKVAVEVRSESVRGEDVTAEFVDLDAQLRNLEAAEAQLQLILKQATATEDVLNVYRELTQIRGQIEQITGRMKYLSQSAALATISATLIPDTLAQPVDVGGWRPAGVAKAAFEALIAALQGLANAAIWFAIAIVPLLLVIALPVVVIAALVRRSLRTRRAAA